MADPRRTLRLAVSMRGGVSLAVWIGGAVAEIDALRWDLARGDQARTTLGRVARALDTKAIEIDVISGTSAGGLNGVVLATAMANRTPVEGLRAVWLRTADLAALMRPGGWARRRSILDSEEFFERARTAICSMGPTKDGAEAPDLLAPKLEQLEAYFPVTSVVPATTTAWADPLAPVSERRVGGWIWLHHPADAPAPVGEPLPHPPASDFVLTRPDTDAHRDKVDALALTICSTAAFPVAFAPTCIPNHVLPDRIRFLGGRRPEPLYLYDGGVVDNMPVGRAVAAISRAQADGPTERVLVYMHPSPGANRARPKDPLEGLAADDRPAPVDVGASALNVLRGKSLVDDLGELEDHNRSVRWQMRDRAAALAAPVAVDDERDEEAVRATLATHDAERLTSLLCDPTPHLEALGPDGLLDAWLTEADGASRQRWVRAFTDQIREQQLELRPWSAFIRTASRLIEWSRWLEAATDPADAVSETKKQIHALRAGALLEASELDRKTLLLLPEGPSERLSDPAPEAAVVVAHRQRILEDRHTTVHLTKVWAQLVALAADLLGHHPEGAAKADRTTPANALPLALAARLRDADDLRKALQHLDDDLLSVHGHAPTGSLDQVRYHTLAGTAPTPLSTCFPWPDGFRPLELPLKLAPLEASDGTPDRLGRLDPESKLAGNQLMNFAAFLDAGWRANDWMWGRADAADTIIRLLVDPTHTVPDPMAAARAIRDACLDEETWPEDIVAPWKAQLQALAHQPWRRGDGDDSDAVVKIAAELEGTDPRVVTHAVVAWRRHLEVLAVELSRSRDENPNQASTAKPEEQSFADALRDWSQPTRRLRSRWGGISEASLGVSAVFRTMGTILGRTPLWARLIGLVVAPFAGPVVGVALARRRGVAAAVVALTGVTLPRTYGDDVGSLLATLLIVGVAVGGARLTWGPGPTKDRWRDEAWSVAALLVAVAATASTIAVWVDPDLTATARRGWLPEGLGPDQVLVATVAAVLATWWVWFWMRTLVRVPLSAGIGALVGFWVWQGTYLSDSWLAQRFAWFEAIGWCLLAVIGVTSIVGFNVPRLGPRPPAAGPSKVRDVGCTLHREKATAKAVPAEPAPAGAGRKA
ncbi:MAG TPA: DUF3376 domain-containing protein [Iamia sp.]